ncbi:MAG: AbiEi antitoxin N-terminal domain-containing protein [Chthoniobacter sp.]|nr:AbiEi antitoxin N-terminal domain-containing protein [Chthoniobacter sp.]
MDSLKRNNPLKRLQTETRRGGPLDVSTLRSIGVSASHARNYVHTGWLRSLGRGVFAFPNDSLERDACLKFLAKTVPGLHVAGKTALDWRGVRHNISFRDHLTLLGDVSKPLPEWFTSRFSCSYAARHLFTSELPKDFGLEPLSETPEGPLVSVRERALLELLSEVGLSQGVEEARNIMENLFEVREDVLEQLLECCSRSKVLRLCAQWSDEMGLRWAPVARTALDATPHRGRWSARMRNGRTLVLKP